MCKKKLSEFMPTIQCCKVFVSSTILAKNQIFKENNEHGLKNRTPGGGKNCFAVSNIIKLTVLNEVSKLQEKLQNSKPAKFCQQNHINTCLFGEQSILFFHF